MLKQVFWQNRSEHYLERYSARPLRKYAVLDHAKYAEVQNGVELSNSKPKQKHKSRAGNQQ